MFRSPDTAVVRRRGNGETIVLYIRAAAVRQDVPVDQSGRCPLPHPSPPPPATHPPSRHSEPTAREIRGLLTKPIVHIRNGCGCACVAAVIAFRGSHGLVEWGLEVGCSQSTVILLTVSPYLWSIYIYIYILPDRVIIGLERVLYVLRCEWWALLIAVAVFGSDVFFFLLKINIKIASRKCVLTYGQWRI